MPHFWIQDAQGGVTNTRTGVKIGVKSSGAQHTVHIGAEAVFTTNHREEADGKLAAIIQALTAGGDTVVIIDDL